MVHSVSRGTFSALLCFAIAATSALAGSKPSQSDHSTPLLAVRAGQRQLFLDDSGVQRRENAHPVMHQPVKHGAVLRSPDPKQTVQTRTAPVWDPERRCYLLWVLGIDQGLWQSRDGLHWQPVAKPNLPVQMAVLDSTEKDPSRRFKAVLLNEGFAVSGDGVQWQRVDVPRIPSSDEGNFSFDPGTHLFIHTVKRRGPNGRSVAVATSPDFQKWTDHGLVFHADEEDQKRGQQHIEARFADRTLQPMRFRDATAYHVDVYNMGVFHYEGLVIGCPAMFHSTGKIPNYPNTDGFHLVQLVCSRDLKNWTRVCDRQTFIGPSRLDSGAYDLTQIIGPSAPVVHGDELWFYYTGLKSRANFDYQGSYPGGKSVSVPGMDRDVGAVCLATLRRDGFVSLDAGEKPGIVQTKRFHLPSGRLYVNVDASGGEYRVEMLGAKERVIARSKPLRGDSVSQSIAWEVDTLEKSVGQEVSIRFTIRNARLFSYWFE